ncbi:MAG: hypothetical protein PF481_07475 [Bacteroidales bacterium]|nr:hypothetical protein [Bacteroidales bacterium]
MKNPLNILIIISGVLLGVLILMHLNYSVYYEIKGLEGRFPDIQKGDTRIYLTIEENDTLIEFEVNFINVENDIQVKEFNIDIYNSNRLLEIVDTKPLNLFIEANTGYRTLSRKINSSIPNKMILILEYEEKGLTHLIELNTEITRKKDWNIHSNNMFNPFILLIPFFKYLLMFLILLRIIIYLKRKKTPPNN